MKTKVSISITITICAFFFTILYILFAADSLTKEYQFVPEWKLDFSNPNVTESSSEKIPFILGQSLGYFTEDGKLTYYKSFPSKATISSSYFATYNTEAVNIPFYSNNGTEKAIIEGAGFPFIQDERVYLLQPGGTAFSFYDENGKNKWTCENVIPITALSSNKYFTISGYANGVIKIHSNATGDTLSHFAPGGSDYPVIYGTDINKDGKYIAAICGQNPQRFIIAQRDQDQTKIIFHEDIASEIRRRTLVKFNAEGNKVFYNYQNGLGIYDLENKQHYKFPMGEKILQIEESENLIIVLSNNRKHFTITLYEKTNTQVGSFDFEASNACIMVKNENLYIGRDQTISKISLRRE